MIGTDIQQRYNDDVLREMHWDAELFSIMPIDYSKFDKLDCSDDETRSPPTQPSPKKECSSCGIIPEVALRCGQCKVSVYCTTKCQREDWKYHKRNCRAPESEESSDSESSSNPDPIKTANKPRSKPDHDSHDEEDEKLDWYRHREWKPENAVPTAQFRPAIITDQAAVVEAAPAVHKSAWNAGDTWEDRDCLPRVKEWVVREITSIDPTMVEEITDITGFASITNVRGKIRYLFDISFKIKTKYSKKIVVEVCDFTSCSDSPAEVAVTGGNDVVIRDFVRSASFVAALDKKREDLLEYVKQL